MGVKTAFHETRYLILANTRGPRPHNINQCRVSSQLLQPERLITGHGSVAALIDDYKPFRSCGTPVTLPRVVAVVAESRRWITVPEAGRSEQPCSRPPDELRFVEKMS